MAEQNKVILHGMWASLFAKRVELALKLKAIPYDCVEEDLANKSELLLKYNPVHKKVPVLVHNGKAISESLVILEYIDETWNHGPKLLPHDPYKRAQARFWCKFIDEKLLPENVLLVIKTEGEIQQKAIRELYEKLRLLEDGMKNFFEGESPNFDDKTNLGLLDIVFVSLFGPSRVQEEVLGVKFIVPEKFPLLFSWLMALVELNLVKEASLPHDKAVEILKLMRHSALTSSATA